VVLLPFALPLKLPMPLSVMFGVSGFAETALLMPREVKRNRTSLTACRPRIETICVVNDCGDSSNLVATSFVAALPKPFGDSRSE
jgi:hypothetical protein